MKSLKIAFLSMLVLLALVAAGCGGDSQEVPADAIAVVDGTNVPKSEFDALITQAKKSYSLQKRDFPKAGSPEYNTLKNQAVQFLVQRTQFELQADELDVAVTEKQIADRLAQIKKQYFGGSDKKYRDQLEQQGLTEEQVKRDIRAQLLQEGIFKKVTADVKVTDKEIQDYYTKNKSQFGTPEQRDVRHILVPTKKQADSLYAQIQDGADFAALAKKFSKDPASAPQGGKLTIARGQTVPTFDQTAFLLAKDTVSRPVKTQYGYHIIKPISDIKPAKTTPLKQVKESIRQQLLQTKRNEAMTKWVEETKKDFEEKTDYQVGFTPPKAAATTTGATTTAG
ncbi:MAG TPA: peptidylprolyl isomerase [Gaiellaceae bacterium]|nr:peptidylprolyl isomerase [Gaiellaceae bacterium]